jgi:exopolysaccharide biosynthesis predicted pyruvyltransferase EpsI
MGNFETSVIPDMPIEKIALGDWLKSEAANQVVHWYPNPGNAGDSLIAAATEYVFRKHGIDFRTICDPGNFDSRRKFVCYGGGGNLISRYDKARWFLRRHHKKAARLVVLSHTVEGNEELLAGLSSRIAIVCREPVSYAHCRAAAPNAAVLAADDLGLSLDPGFLSTWRLIPSALAERQAYASFRRIFRDFTKMFHGMNELTAWRGDMERHPLRKEPPEGDLSKMFGLKAIGVSPEDRTLNKFRLSAYFFLRAIDRFSLVRTDRLHLAIGAAILGKKVELYPNDYYKNRAVYDFSLKALPNVRFVEWDETL